MTQQDVLNAIEQTPARSAWQRGVKQYAYNMIDDRFDGGADYETLSEKDLLGGAKDWHQYSWHGYAFCYNKDIAQILCTPSELKRTKNGQLRPNRHEEWLDVQARALTQAAQLILDIIHG